MEQSQVGPAGSPFKATAAIMRDLRDEIRQVVSHQGIRGTSYRDHVDRWFSGLNNFLASGPPASRVEELEALVTAGRGPDGRPADAGRGRRRRPAASWSPPPTSTRRRWWSAR